MNSTISNFNAAILATLKAAVRMASEEHEATADRLGEEHPETKRAELAYELAFEAYSAARATIGFGTIVDR